MFKSENMAGGTLSLEKSTGVLRPVANMTTTTNGVR